MSEIVMLVEPEPGTVRRFCPEITADHPLFLVLSGYQASANDWGALKRDVDAGPPLVEAPRGLPGDVSRAMKKATHRRWPGTLSWVTAAEVLAFDWTRFRSANAWTSLDEFLHAARTLRPGDRIFIFLEDDSVY